MNKKIVSLKEAEGITKALSSQRKTFVLAGGCFDLVHIGHIEFLVNAKKQGDILVILLESDETIKRRKGENRPINSQQDRAYLLSHLSMVDYVVLLPEMKTDEEYTKLVIMLKPDIIAITADDPQIRQKEKQATLINARVVSVTPVLVNQSTSRLVHLLKIYE